MTLLLSQTERRTALEAAARSPAQGADPGFLDRFEADRQAMVNFSNINAEFLGKKAAQDEFIARFNRESGQQLRPWLDAQSGPGPIWNEAAAKAQFDAWKQENPGSELIFPDREKLEASARERSAEARRRSLDAGERTTSPLTSLGGFAGTMVGAMQDPINLLSMAFGAGPAQGVVRTALVEGAIGAASESVVQAGNYRYKREVDPNFSASEAAGEVLAAGVGGAVFGGGLKGLAAVWHRVKTGNWPQYVQDAGKIVTREATVPESRYSKSPDGVSAHNAAYSKAVDDIASNKPVEIPQEAYMESRARLGRVYDADGRSVGVKYEVVEASDLVTSHNDDLSTNVAFPPELQPRDRSRALSAEQINSIAGNLQPERLGPSIQAESGAPIVGPDGLVESGNARVLSLRRAYGQGGVSAQNYRRFLESQGFDLEGMANPVMIARRVTELEGKERVAFTAAANRSTALRLGASEQALADARLIDGDLVSRLTEGDVGAADNRSFVRGFLSKLPRAEQGEMIDKGGQLSQAGERRIAAALMGRAYGEPRLLGRALEDADSNIKSIGGALTDAAGPWSIMRDAVARGDIPNGMDVTKDLMEAVSLIMKARDQGVLVKDLVNQAEMFGGPGDIAKIMARAMFSDEEMRRPVSRKRLGQFLRDYADEAIKNDAGPRLFGDPLESADVLRSSLSRVGREDLERIVNDRLTPEHVDELARAPETGEAVLQEANRLIAREVLDEPADAVIEEGPAAYRALAARGTDDPKISEVMSNAEAMTDPVAVALRYAEEGTAIYREIDAARDAVRSLEKGLMKKYGVTSVDALDDVDLTDSERAFLFYSDIPEPTEFHDIVDMISPVDTLEEAATELRYAMNKLPDPGKPSTRFDQKVAEGRILHLGREIERLGGDPQAVIEEAAQQVASRHADLDDAEFMVRNNLERLRAYIDPVAASKRTENYGVQEDPSKLLVDMGDGRGERPLSEIFDEADAEIDAAADLEACALGRSSTAAE